MEKIYELKEKVDIDLKNKLIPELKDGIKFGQSFIKKLQPENGKSITELEKNSTMFNDLTTFNKEELVKHFGNLLSNDKKYNYVWIGIHSTNIDPIITVIGRTSFAEDATIQGDLFKEYRLTGTMKMIVNQVVQELLDKYQAEKLDSEYIYHELNKYTTEAIIFPFAIIDDKNNSVVYKNKVEQFVKDIVKKMVSDFNIKILNKK